MLTLSIKIPAKFGATIFINIFPCHIITPLYHSFYESLILFFLILNNSGGNKRKLSTAMALVGDPPIIFLVSLLYCILARLEWIIGNYKTFNELSELLMLNPFVPNAQFLCPLKRKGVLGTNGLSILKILWTLQVWALSWKEVS